MDTCDMYLFHLIVLLNLVFNFSQILLSSWADKVTTGTYSFVSVILNVAFNGSLIPSNAGLASGTALQYALLVNTQFSLQVKIKDTSQLINAISSVLQKLLRYFNGATTLTSFVQYLLMFL